jgi:hypothetical protein
MEAADYYEPLPKFYPPKKVTFQETVLFTLITVKT